MGKVRLLSYTVAAVGGGRGVGWFAACHIQNLQGKNPLVPKGVVSALVLVGRGRAGGWDEDPDRNRANTH